MEGLVHVRLEDIDDEPPEEVQMQDLELDLKTPRPNSSRFRYRRPQFYVPFIGLMLVMFLSTLDSTIVSTALPTIANSFQRIDLYAWVINAYLIACAIMIPITGSLSDILGRKNLFLGSGLVFLLGSLLCGVAPTMVSLVAFRGIQGLGAGPIYSVCSIIVSDIVPAYHRGRFTGVLGFVFGLATVGGPIVGGLMAQGSTWRLIFLINLPIGIPALVAVWWFLNYEAERVKKQTTDPRTPQSISIHQRSAIARNDVLTMENVTESADFRAESSRPTTEFVYTRRWTLVSRVDYLGMLFLTSFIVLGLLASSFGSYRTFSWSSSQIIGLFAGCGASLVAFVLNEAYVARVPVIPLRMFASMHVSVIQFAMFLIGFLLLGCVSFLPIYFQIIRGDSPTISGVKLLPLMFGLIATAVPSGFFVARRGIAFPFPVIGLAFTTLGVGLMTLLRINTEYGPIFVWLLLIGVGLGLSMQVLVIMLQASVNPKDLPPVVSTNAFLRTLGGILGVQIFQIIIQTWLSKNIPFLSSNQTDNLTRSAITSLTQVQQSRVLFVYNEAINILFFVLIPVAGVAFLLSLLLRKVSIPTKQSMANAVEATSATVI